MVFENIGDKAAQAANSEHGEQLTDHAFDAAGDHAETAIGNQHDEHIQKMRDGADAAVGNE